MGVHHVIKRIVIIFILLIGSVSIHADDNWIHVGMLSKHTNNDTDYNETHKLIGIEYNSWYVGYYDNSYFKDSFFLFHNFRIWNPIQYAHIGAKVGGITGYDDLYQVMGVTPAVIPVLYIDYDPIGIDINFLGKITSVEFKFKF